MEDRIPGWLQYCHEMCCEKGGHHGRQACMITLRRCNFQMSELAYNKYRKYLCGLKHHFAEKNKDIKHEY